MSVWLMGMLVAGLALPVLVAGATVFLGTRRVPGGSAFVRAVFAGLAAGAVGGAAVGALVILLVLALRAAR
jgi:hypothetical protein